MDRGLFEDIYRDMVTDYSKDSVQKELKEVITQLPREFRKMKEAQELALDGIMKTNEGYRRNGRVIPEEEVQATMDRVDRIMLVESPLLQERKLILRGDLLLPDKDALMRGAE